MRNIIRKDSNKINYAYIFNWDTIEVKENYHDIEEINLDSMFNDIKEMKFKYSVWPKNFVVGDFVIDSFVDFGGGFYGGIDHCYDPRYPYDNTVRASSITFGNNIGAYYGYDYYDYWGSISFAKVVEFLKGV